ncbi:MAG: PF20097 family protein [Anaerolineales bacterium]
MVEYKCPKCGSSMEAGWIAEVGSGTRPIRWVRGKPEPSMWTGTRTPKEDTFDVVTYGCASCGFLESYARRTKTDGA